MKKIANDNYTLKQLKDNHVKVQVNIAEIYKEHILALKDKNVNFDRYHLKKNKSYKEVLRGMHPRTNTSLIISKLKELSQQAN
jgi:hypothetical protein